MLSVYIDINLDINQYINRYKSQDFYFLCFNLMILYIHISTVRIKPFYGRNVSGFIS